MPGAYNSEGTYIGKYFNINSKRLYILNIPIESGVTETNAPSGAFAVTTDDEGMTGVFVSDGDLWQPYSLDAVVLAKATGADVDTGTNNTKYVTPKALEDSDYVKAEDLEGNTVATGGAPITVADAAGRFGSIVVSGAGTDAANGTYEYTAENLGHAVYNLVGTDPYVSSVVADNSTHGDPESGVYAFILSGAGARLYKSANTIEDYSGEILEALQDLTNVDGTLPAPTVTFTPGLTGLNHGAEVYQEDNGFVYRLIDPTHPELVGSWQAIPKVYRALLLQTGTSVPTETLLENSLGSAVGITRASAGTYRFAHESFAEGITWCSIVANQINPSNPSGGIVQCGWVGAGQVETTSYAIDGGAAVAADWDNAAFPVSIEILVYPA